MSQTPRVGSSQEVSSELAVLMLLYMMGFVSSLAFLHGGSEDFIIYGLSWCLLNYLCCGNLPSNTPLNAFYCGNLLSHSPLEHPPLPFLFDVFNVVDQTQV